MDHCLLRLYIAGRNARSERAAQGLRCLCERELAGRFELQIIDVLEQPDLADREKILATPTLVRALPAPMRRLVGDVSAVQANPGSLFAPPGSLPAGAAAEGDDPLRESGDCSRRLLAQLAQSEARSRTLVQSHADGILVSDLSGRIRFVNPAAEKLLGRRAEELAGASFGYPMASGEVSQIDVVRGREVLLAEMRVTPLDWEGESALLISLRDVTEKARLEVQLRQAQKLESIGRLAGGIAHDFNNLLTVINGYGDLVLKQLGPADPLRNQIAEIRKAGERAAVLTRQLLAFSRGQLVQRKITDLNAVVADTESLLKRLVGEHVRMEVHLPGELTVNADAGQLGQLLMNLAANARDAMPAGGLLTIRTGRTEVGDRLAKRHGVRPGPYVRLAVADTGTGMDERVKSRLFEPFFTTKQPGAGTGLGLATVYGIVSQHGGFLTVASQLGEGTRFEIYFPAVEPHPAPRANAPADGVTRGSASLLLVEDQADVRHFVASVLRDGGYAVMEAADAEEALRLWPKLPGPVDLVITDVVMPGLGGPDMAALLRRTKPGLRVLFMSGYIAKGPGRLLDYDGAFLRKPFTGEALLTKVRQLLRGE